MTYKTKSKLTGIIFIVILFTISFFYLLVGYQFSVHEGRYDEGLSIYGATRILNGDIPYRDFWTLYAPGEFYLLAWIFKIFGASIIAERITTVVIQTLLAYCVYLITRKLIPPKFALVIWMLTLAWLKVKIHYSCPMTTALLFCMLSCLTIANFIFTRQLQWLIISGILVGITTLFRQDVGFYLFISGSLIIFGLRLFDSGSSTRGLLVRIKKSLYENIWYLWGVIIIVIPVIFYFISKSAIPDLISDVIIFPIKVYPKVRHLPFPKLALNTIIFYLPIFIFLITIYNLVFQIKSNIMTPQKKWLGLLCLFLGIAFLNYTRVRSDIYHLLPTMIPAIILFGILLFTVIENIPIKHRIGSWSIICLTVLTLFVMSILLQLKLWFLHINQPTPSIELSRAHGCYDQTNSILYQRSAIKYIQERTRPNEKIFVSDLRHDRILDNDLMFYFLSERHSATMYHELHPGLVTTVDIQKKIISEIKQSNTRYIVRWGGNKDRLEPNESSKSSGITELDNFIERNFKAVQSFGHYTILYRNIDFPQK